MENSSDITPLQEKEELLKKCEENLKVLKVGYMQKAVFIVLIVSASLPAYRIRI